MLIYLSKLFYRVDLNNFKILPQKMCILQVDLLVDFSLELPGHNLIRMCSVITVKSLLEQIHSES